MYLAHLSLTNFRNYSRLEIDLAQGITLLQGANAQGKTNFLEAIAYLATARSLLSTVERELLHWLAWEEPLPFVRLVGELAAGSLSARGGSRRRRKIEITLLPANGANAAGQRLRKEVRIDGVSRRAIDLVGQMPTVLFLPQDIELISGAPSVRRRYLDIALCQMQADYCRALSAYNKVLQQRNALLKTLRERGGNPEQLAFWDEQLVAQGSLITARRAAFISSLEEEANQRQQLLTGGSERLHLRYLPSLAAEPEEQALADLAEPEEAAWLREPSPVYLAAELAAVAETFQAQLAQLRRRELAAGMSLVGPHRDEVQFTAQGRDLRTYGSRGQQRTAALALKLAEVAVMQQALGAPPLLLLDDVMSELDRGRRALLSSALHGVQQAIVTTTDWGDFSPELRQAARCLHVDQGRIEELASRPSP